MKSMQKMIVAAGLLVAAVFAASSGNEAEAGGCHAGYGYDYRYHVPTYRPVYVAPKYYTPIHYGYGCHF